MKILNLIFSKPGIEYYNSQYSLTDRISIEEYNNLLEFIDNFYILSFLILNFSSIFYFLQLIFKNLMKIEYFFVLLTETIH